jgi:lipid-A-disaccharide synthase
LSNRVFIIAGEASGDLYGAGLVRAMNAVDPSLSFQGLGSRYMREAGVQLLWDAAEMAVVGFSEVAAHLLTIGKVFKKSIAVLRSWRPDLVILIDYPEFNLLLAWKAKKLGIPVMYYVSPQVWAWRPGRVNTIRQRVDRMVVILPFEESLYRKAGVRVSFVGHPLLDSVRVKDEWELPRNRYVRPGRERLVGLLPGSRQGELRALLPVMLDAAGILAERIQGIHFLLPLASTIRSEQVDPFLKGRELPLTVVENETHDVIQMCEVVIVASGTVTLEAAILGTPLVVIYKVHPLTYWLGKRLIKVKHVALANIVAGETIAKEFLQQQAKPETIAREVLSILEDEERQGWMRQHLARVHDKLGSPGAAARAAGIALEMLRRANPLFLSPLRANESCRSS